MQDCGYCPPGDSAAFRRSRETHLPVDSRTHPRVLAIVGGKLTGYRATAQKVMNIPATHLARADAAGGYRNAAPQARPLMPDLILAIDQGTHSSRAIIFDAHGHVVASAQQSVTLQQHSRTEIEQSPAEILQSVQAVIASVLDAPGIDREHISCAGMATQRSSVVAWERHSGLPLSPVISWQDRRTADELHRLRDKAA